MMPVFIEPTRTVAVKVDIKNIVCPLEGLSRVPSGPNSIEGPSDDSPCCSIEDLSTESSFVSMVIAEWMAVFAQGRYVARNLIAERKG